ncbi:hypothetical protein CJ030_MR2G011255 [Morella rubra]|uniref:Uncharacterized protein n=2 Tax=Morella rubra TaxID=262757 RepID=A0A6A1WKY0_9ROSI|nr:hypothetical protein CJ030_MR2G011255 [Morella rubra]
MMTLERRMEYLRGRPVAKERPVTLSDFDQLLYEEHSLYQLFKYQGFLHQLSWTEGFCVDAVVQDFFCALVSVDRAPEVQLENSFHRVPFTRAQCMLLLGQQTRINFLLYMFELIMDEAWGIKEYSLPYGMFLTQFLISRGVVIAASDSCKEVNNALNKLGGALTQRDTEVRKMHGGTRMTDVWNLKEDEMIPVQFNGNGQPLETVYNPRASIGGYCQELVPQRFRREMEEYKCSLKQKYFDEAFTPQYVKSNAPIDVNLEQFCKLVDFWYSDAGRHRSHAGKQNKSLQTTVHTAGSKSFARYAHELEKEKQVPINRADLYKAVHMRSDGSPINPDVAKKIRRMEEIGLNDSGSSQTSNEFRVDGSIGWSPSDRYAQVIGPERHGRIRGVGLGPTPSSHPANTNVRSSQPTSSSNERAVFMENRVQMLESEVASLKSTIQMMAQAWEQRQYQDVPNNNQVSPAIHRSSHASRKTSVADNADDAESAGADGAEGGED